MSYYNQDYITQSLSKIYDTYKDSEIVELIGCDLSQAPEEDSNVCDDDENTYDMRSDFLSQIDFSKFSKMKTLNLSSGWQEKSKSRKLTNYPYTFDCSLLSNVFLENLIVDTVVLKNVEKLTVKDIAIEENSTNVEEFLKLRGLTSFSFGISSYYVQDEEEGSFGFGHCDILELAENNPELKFLGGYDPETNFEYNEWDEEYTSLGPKLRALLPMCEIDLHCLLDLPPPSPPVHRKDGLTVSEDGTQEWYLNSKLHRVDGPAIVRVDGKEEWYFNGKLHRCKSENGVDGPAIVYSDGTKAWYRHGKLHREDGPAVYDENAEYERWYQNGYLHRVDEPAINSKKLKAWYLNGKLHRVNGPAYCDLYTNKQKWAQNGRYHRVDGPAIFDSYESYAWYLDGKLHRADGPARFISSYNLTSWYLNGKLHRVDGPASVSPSEEAWYLNGKLHRGKAENGVDGPAVVSSDGKKEWYLNGNLRQGKDDPVESG